MSEEAVVCPRCGEFLGTLDKLDSCPICGHVFVKEDNESTKEE